MSILEAKYKSVTFGSYYGLTHLEATQVTFGIFLDLSYLKPVYSVTFGSVDGLSHLEAIRDSV